MQILVDPHAREPLISRQVEAGVEHFIVYEALLLHRAKEPPILGSLEAQVEGVERFITYEEFLLILAKAQLLLVDQQKYAH
jgi:hypothetical protein